MSLTYDAMGNILTKSDVANGATWTYSVAHKHQVMQAGNSNFTYSYDANGNAITRNGASISWSKYNYPTLINGNGESTNLFYDANNARWKQVYTKGTATETTIYVGEQLEKVTSSGVDDYRYYISANGQAVAIVSRTTSGSNTTRYLLRDGLGSVVKISDSSGAELVSESFSAFGTRRNPQTWSGVPTNGDQVASNGVTREGYTGQDALGSMGLNHMNGRVQDAITGRFISADPFISEPGNTQNYNRYAYVNNNPLSFIDPSGFAEVCITSDVTHIYEEVIDGVRRQTTTYLTFINCSYAPDSDPSTGVPGGTPSGQPANKPSPSPTSSPTASQAPPGTQPQTQKQGCQNAAASNDDFTFDDFVNFSAGLGDVLLLGFGDDIRDALDIGSIDMSSSAYGAGEVTGTVALAATGVAGGIRAAGTAGVRGSGIEFSHAIPARMGGPRSIWNGNYVSREFHALSDPYRYRFMSRAWKELNQMPSRLKQLWDRTPKTWKGTAAGGAAAGAGVAGSGC